MTSAVALWTAAAPFLLLVWLFQRIPGLRGARGLILALALALAALFHSWFGHWLPFWSASLSANFSVVMAGLLLASICDRACRCRIFRARDWQAAWTFGAIASLLLYPSALGLGPQNFDSYALGWPWLFRGQSLALFGGAGLAAAWLVWRGNRFGFLLGLALLGYSAGFQESENLWDYLLDPVYGAVSLLLALRTLLLRVIPRPRSGDPAGTVGR